jgi:hypothetical protein
MVRAALARHRLRELAFCAKLEIIVQVATSPKRPVLQVTSALKEHRSQLSILALSTRITQILVHLHSALASLALLAKSVLKALLSHLIAHLARTAALRPGTLDLAHLEPTQAQVRVLHAQPVNIVSLALLTA